MTTPPLSPEGQYYEELFRRGVAREIAELQAKGFSPIQVIDGYLVALEPSGRVRRLHKLRDG